MVWAIDNQPAYSTFSQRMFMPTERLTTALRAVLRPATWPRICSFCACIPVVLVLLSDLD